MKGVNKAILLGTLGKDPEVKHTEAGSSIVNFSIATSESWKDKTTGKKVEKTEWHNVVAFGTLADIIAKYVKKGSKVYVEGSIKTRKWQDKEGKDRYTTEIVAKELQMLDSKPAVQSGEAPAPAEYVPDGFENSDIPF